MTLVIFHGLPQSLRTNSRIVPQIRHICFLLQHLEFRGLFFTVIRSLDTVQSEFAIGLDSQASNKLKKIAGRSAM